MGLSVERFMVREVVVAQSRETVGEIRERMLTHEIHALPVVDERNRPAGIVTASDLVEEFDAALPVSQVMTPRIYSVERSTGVEVAARTMRNHRIHHLLVTDGGRIVGMLSAFDLLRIIENGEFS